MSIKVSEPSIESVSEAFDQLDAEKKLENQQILIQNFETQKNDEEKPISSDDMVKVYMANIPKTAKKEEVIDLIQKTEPYTELELPTSFRKRLKGMVSLTFRILHYFL